MNQKYLYLILAGGIVLAILGVFLYGEMGPRGASAPIDSGDLAGGDVFPETRDVPPGSPTQGRSGSGAFSETSSPSVPLTTSQGPSRVLDMAAYLTRISGTSRFMAASEQGEIFIGDESGVFTKQEGAPGLGAVAVSRDGLKILKKRIEGETTVYVVSDLGAKKEYVLGNEDTVHAPVFSHDSKKLYFLYRDPAKQTRYLASSNLNLSGIKKIAALNFLDMNMMRLGKDKLLLTPKPSGYVYGSAYSFSLSNVKLTKLFSGYGVSAFPNEEGTRIIYSSTETGGRNVKMSVYDVVKHTNKELGLRTFAEKCALGGTTLLCALPAQFDPGLVYPDSYYQGVFAPPDDIIAIDPETTAVRKVVALSHDLGPRVSALGVSVDGSKVFFINARDQGLYRLEL